MLVIETMEDGRVHTYSDAGMLIRQNETDILYEDAVDIPGHFTYTETDIPIEEEGEEATPEDYEEALNEMGVET